MNEEQIKQNAEIYAEQNKVNFSEDKNFAVYDYDEQKDAYIAGAHIRDDEIKELEEELSSLQEHYDSLLDGFSKRGTKLGELMKENIKLRNPWISVEDRLPEKIKNKEISKYVFVIWPDGTHGEAYYNYEEHNGPRWEIKGAGIMKPAYWMSIPTIPKSKLKKYV